MITLTFSRFIVKIILLTYLITRFNNVIICNISNIKTIKTW